MNHVPTQIPKPKEIKQAEKQRMDDIPQHLATLTHMFDLLLQRLVVPDFLSILG
jgi:hypothetical protein